MIGVNNLRKQKRNWNIENCSSLVFLVYIVCYGAYVAFGGLIFLAIEINVNDSIDHQIQTAKSGVLKKFPNASNEVMDEFVQEMSFAGIRGLKNINDTEAKWTYSQSVFFCVTLLSTIGYGHVAPVSQLGKAVCMVYTAFGIPFTLILLAAWVDRLLNAVKIAERVTYSCFRGMLKPLTAKLIFCIFTTVLISVLFLFLPALLFYHLEKQWTYLDAVYFCFISLTTVGLGDFVPGEYTEVAYRAIYRIGLCFYLVFGMVAMMFLMSLVTYLHEEFFERRSNEERDAISSDRSTYGSITDDKVMLYQNREDVQLSD